MEKNNNTIGIYAEGNLDFKSGTIVSQFGESDNNSLGFYATGNITVYEGAGVEALYVGREPGSEAQKSIIGMLAENKLNLKEGSLISFISYNAAIAAKEITKPIEFIKVQPAEPTSLSIDDINPGEALPYSVEKIDQGGKTYETVFDTANSRPVAELEASIRLPKQEEVNNNTPSCSLKDDKNCDGVVTCDEVIGIGWTWNEDKKACVFIGNNSSNSNVYIVNTSTK